jgi:myo-inositol-1(or 4)-monophosphatase
MSALGELVDLALEVGANAAAQLLEGFGTTIAKTSTKSSPTDLVTDRDEASQRTIIDGLLAARPHDGIVAEEDTDVNIEGTSGVRWIVDPLDGTTNYAAGLPNWSVSIAAEADGEIVVGVVIAPELRRSYAAVRGGGARRDGALLSGSTCDNLADALVGTGFSYQEHERALQAATLTQILPRVKDIRRSGSAALDLCWTAEGAMDAYYERGPKYWDWAAGGLIAHEAGMRFGGLIRTPPHHDTVISASPALFDAVREILIVAEKSRGWDRPPAHRFQP